LLQQSPGVRQLSLTTGANSVQESDGIGQENGREETTSGSREPHESHLGRRKFAIQGVWKGRQVMAYVIGEPIQIANREYRRVEIQFTDGSTGRVWEWRLLDRPTMPFVEVASYSIRAELDAGEVPAHLR
jgi:hypothetical protein